MFDSYLTTDPNDATLDARCECTDATDACPDCHEVADLLTRRATRASLEMQLASIRESVGTTLDSQNDLSPRELRRRLATIHELLVELESDVRESA